MYKTIETRKRDESTRRNRAVDVLFDKLSRYAREKGGRFILFGSLARGEARFDSDVDLIVDFPPEWEGEAWRLAEDLCAELKIEPDIKSLAWCDPKFISRVMAEARVIG
jgi:predicted nucleotidyltransferase